ncbi:MAG: RES family NAD+ phosphorylase [Gammaproteobacteria bacterium]|nr:RES family NAD+ phosphorylase [Gammaproteobacteria bacterium]
MLDKENAVIKLDAFSGIVWRILFADLSKQTSEPVRSPVGRFHHSGQVALYSSCTEEGAGVAIKRYVKSNDPERIIVPLQVVADRIYDIRRTSFSKSASIVWQNCVEKGEPAPTWRFSDSARNAGAQGMLYASRSRPDLTHLVLFDVSYGIVKQAGDVKAWPTGTVDFLNSPTKKGLES